MIRVKTLATSVAATGLLAAGIAFFAPQKAFAASCGLPDDLPSGCHYQYSHVPCTACGPGYVGLRKVAGPSGCPLFVCELL